MISSIARLLLGLGLGAGIATVSFAQDVATNPVAEHTAWTIYDADDRDQCWLVSAPVAGKSTATREGRPVAVRRGDILFFVSFWSDATKGGKGEVSFMGGYEFAEGKPVVLSIGSQRFDLFTEGEFAYATSPEQDQQIARAMKAGAVATVTGVSQRSGTETKDEFSLMGFTAAYDDASRRCES